MVFWGIARRSGVFVMGAGSMYLGSQVYDYNQLRKIMIKIGPIDQPKIVTVPSTQKEWIMFGRQSPGYARDIGSKNALRQKIQLSSIYLKVLGSRLDNEKHYDLFEGSDFQVQMFSSDKKKPGVVVKPEMMMSTDLDEIDPEAKFEVGFARKQGFADVTKKSPLFHSSIALRKISEDEQPDQHAVVMTGSEVQRVIAETDEAICGEQSCNLYQSNCYSASIFAMGRIIRALDHRDDPKSSDDIQSVASVLSGAALDNCGRGVSNNSVVLSQLRSSVYSVLKRRSLLLSEQPESEPPGFEPPGFEG